MTDLASRLASLRRRLARAKPSAVAKLSGLSDRTVQRIRDGLNSPNMDTFLRLEAALKALQPAKAR